MTRNIFHQRIESLHDIRLGIQQARDAILLDVQSGFTDSEALLNALSNETKEFRAEAKNFVPELRSTIEQAKYDIVTILSFKPTAKDITPKALTCIRVLSQVQDLATDKTPNLAQNNQTLGKYRNSKPYDEATKALGGSEPISSSFVAAFSDFAKGDTNEMAMRLLDILGLYQSLIKHFAANPK